MSKGKAIFSVILAISTWGIAAKSSLANSEFLLSQGWGKIPQEERPIPSSLPEDQPSTERNGRDGVVIRGGSRRKRASFACVTNGNTPVTIVNSADGKQASLLHWYDRYFSSQGEARQLCQSVAEKLELYNNRNGLKNVSFATGTVNNRSIVCLKNNGRCTSADPELFVLNTDQSPNLVLKDMTNFPDDARITRRGHFTIPLNFFDFPF